jgi:hypothetical protein
MTTVLPRPLSPSTSEARSELPAERPVGARIRTRLARRDGYVSLLVYLAIAMLWYRGVITHMTSNCACGLAADPGDNADFVWWLQWFVHALGHGLPLWHPTVVWTPTGVNLAGTTASLLMAVVTAPVTLLFGPVAAYNVWMILGPVLSAWAANRLCRHITGSAWASLIAGATYGFSSFEITHLVGHPQMVLMAGPALLALCVIRFLDRTWARRRFIVCTSLVLIAQIFISVEVTFTMTVAGAIALFAFWVTGTPDERRRLVGSLRTLAIPWLVAAVVTGWYTVQVLAAPAYADGAAYLYPTDLLAFLVPEQYTWFGGARLAGVSAHFLGTTNETTAYLGWPLLLVIGHYLRTQRRTRNAKAIAILLAVLTVWILGPILYIAGRTVSSLPYRMFAGLPLISETLVSRLAIYLALTAAVVLAMWLATPHRRRPLAWTCGALAVALLLPNLASPNPRNVSTWTRPAFFYTNSYKHYLRRGESVLPLPWGYQTEAYVWQAHDDMYWNIAGGYWLFFPPASWSSKLTLDLWHDQPTAGDGPPLRALLVKRHVSDVIVQNGYGKLWGPTLRQAGLRVTAAVGGVTVYHVPSTWLAQRPTSTPRA